MAISKPKKTTSVRTRTQSRMAEWKEQWKERRIAGKERKVIRSEIEQRYRTVEGREGFLHQKIHQHRAATALQQGSLIPSSWIKSLAYDSTKKEAIAVFLSGTYIFDNVPENIFNRWWEGKATCQTSDFGLIKRWWRGKTPSLGAFFNQYIKGKFNSRRV